jgi:hypothetical protein
MVVPIALANATLRISGSDNRLTFSTLDMLPPWLRLGENGASVNEVLLTACCSMSGQ